MRSLLCTLEDGLLYLESFLTSTEVAVVRLTGALFGEPACESLHRECARLAGHHLILDCSELVSLHQQGTIPLRRLAQAAWECGRQMALVGLHRHPARVLADSGLDRYFQRYESLKAAVAALGH